MPVELEQRVALLEAEVDRLKHQLPSVNTKTEHPMLKFAGIFKDDPDFAAVVASKFRRVGNAHGINHNGVNICSIEH